VRPKACMALNGSSGRAIMMAVAMARTTEVSAVASAAAILFRRQGHGSREGGDLRNRWRLRRCPRGCGEP
jgi:hypothetical protein